MASRTSRRDGAPSLTTSVEGEVVADAALLRTMRFVVEVVADDDLLVVLINIDKVGWIDDISADGDGVGVWFAPVAIAMVSWSIGPSCLLCMCLCYLCILFL